MSYTVAIQPLIQTVSTQLGITARKENGKTHGFQVNV